jgi:hypothetical protein
MEIINSEIDVCLRWLYISESRGIYIHTLLEKIRPNIIAFDLDFQNRLIEKLDFELRIADYNIGSSQFIIIQRGKSIWLDYGSYTEFKAARDKENLIIESQNALNNKMVTHNNQMACLTKILAVGTSIAAVYYLIEIVKFVYSYYRR